MSEKNIATMTAAELALHIKTMEARQRRVIVALRALLRVREAEEATIAEATEK